MTDTPDPQVTPAPAPSAQEAGSDKLIERLRGFLGLKSQGSLRENLAEVLGEGETGTDFSPEERAMLRNILGLRSLRVGDVMVPRADIVAVAKDTTIAEVLRVFASAAHSRLVVYGETLDDPVGMIHIRDLVAHLTQRATLPGNTAAARHGGYDIAAIDLGERLGDTGLLRHLLFVPPSMPTVDLLVKMQATRIHLALVIDEYGGTDGLVSIEDMVEQVVGDIEDEHDEEDGPSIVVQEDGTWVADARVALDELPESFGAAFAAMEGAEDVDTLGGLLVTLAGRVPVRGEILPGPAGYEIEVLDADPRRVKRLKIGPVNETAAQARRERAASRAAPAPDADGAPEPP